MKKCICVLLLAAISITPAIAFTDWSVTKAHVTLIEGTYVPGIVNFTIDVPAGPCAAGAFLQYNGQGSDPASNVKAVYALLLTAKISGQTVNLYGSNTLTSNGWCLVQFIHIQ